MELVSPSTAWQSLGENIRCWNQANGWKGWTKSIDLDQWIWKCLVLSSSYLPFTAFISLHPTTNLDFHPKPMSIAILVVFFFNVLICFVSNIFQPRSFYGPMFAIWRIRVPHHCHCAKSSPLHPSKSLSWRIENFPFALPSEYDRSRRQMDARWSRCLKIDPKHLKLTYCWRIFDFMGLLESNSQVFVIEFETVLQPENKTICQDVPGWHESQDRGCGWGFNRFHTY